MIDNPVCAICREGDAIYCLYDIKQWRTRIGKDGQLEYICPDCYKWMVSLMEKVK